MIEVWKILNEEEDVKYSTWFTMASDHSMKVTRQSSNPYNILKPKYNSDIRKNFFSVRIVDMWNNLLENVHKAGSIGDFKGMYY